eukprot:COSAG06_NODE_672_length_13192_cov_17.308104_7_plen_145_part_00
MRCATLAALACALGLVRAVPTVPEQSFEEAIVGNGSADDGPRRLQAGGRPDQCSDDSSFQAWLALVNSACCTHAATPCTNGLPSACDEECANVLTPVRTALSPRLLRDACCCGARRYRVQIRRRWLRREGDGLRQVVCVRPRSC